MRNTSEWKPGKFVFRKGRLRASRDRREVSVSSRLITDLVAQNYQEYIDRFVSGHLLDLGCGKVPLYEAYRAKARSVTCVDWGNSLHRNRHIDVECDLTEPLPFANEQFNTIILSDVLEHIPEPLELWREMSRVLADDGVIIMNVPFFYWLHETPHDYYRYTEFALRRFSSTVGLQLLDIRVIGSVPQIVADIAAKQVVRMPAVGCTLADLVQRLALSLTRKRERPADFAGKSHTAAFPLGYFMVSRKAVTASAWIADGRSVDD